MLNKWYELKKYINSHILFTRKELKQNFLEGNTIDNYINLTAQAGFIIKYGRGKYKKLCNIPDNITSSHLQKIAYDKEFREKMIIKLNRKQKLENINKQKNP